MCILVPEPMALEFVRLRGEVERLEAENRRLEDDNHGLRRESDSLHRALAERALQAARPRLEDGSREVLVHRG